MAFCDYTRFIYIGIFAAILILLRWGLSRRRAKKKNTQGSCSSPPEHTDLLPYPTLGSKDQTLVINYNTSWCGFSRQLQPTWTKLMDYYKKTKGIKLVDMKCDKYDCSKIAIRGYPSVIAQTPDGRTKEYEGERSFEGLRKFIDSLTTTTV